MRKGWSTQPFSITALAATWLVLAVALALGQETLAQETDGLESAATTDSSTGGIERTFSSSVQPLLQRYCHECHAGDRTEADIDLAEFKTVATVRKQVKIWLKVHEMLDSGQMPPKDSRQPDDAQRALLTKWVHEFLTTEAKARAGDPGPVVLRRLNNAEYNYTIRDLTGIGTLDPTREFPVDGAAGEGFTNTGSAQAMSPSLVRKYLDAAKSIAAHAVLLPDGMRFSPHTTRRDHTDELLARIQQFYRNFTEDGGGSAVNLQGIKFDTNQGGLLPLQKYIAATLEERDALVAEKTTIDEVARQRSLNARYLGTLWKTLTAASDADRPSLLIDAVRRNWNLAQPKDAAAVAAEISQLQKTLWKFNSVGQLGEGGQQKRWMEPIAPIVSRQELRLALPSSTKDQASATDDTIIYLVANDLGNNELSDGRDNAFVIWDQPRFVFNGDAESAPSHPPILLKDIYDMSERIRASMAAELPRTEAYLEAAAELQSPQTTIHEMAQARNLNPQLLTRWVELAGLGHRENRKIRGHFTTRMTKAHGYEAVNGWGTPQTPNMLTNRSGQDVSFLTLTVPAHGVVMHPSPTQESVVAWRSPLEGQVRLDGLVADADSVCGNGAAWRVELISATGVSQLAAGQFDNGGKQAFRSAAEFSVRVGDVVSLIVNARDNSHACDTTHVELKLSESGGNKRLWDLSADVVERILEANPLPDAYGHAETWHFCATGAKPPATSRLIPGSALAAWRTAVIEDRSADEIRQLAAGIRSLLTKADAKRSAADQQLRVQLLDWKGPLRWTTSATTIQPAADSTFGIEPGRFGKHPAGARINPSSLCQRAPHVLEIRLPTALVAGSELVVSGELHAETSPAGSVQLQVLPTRPGPLRISPALPILVRAGGAAQRRLEASMTEFRELFPAALCYARIVPVDEVVTMTLFFREDDHLKRLMLSPQEAAALDRLWDELFYVAQEPLALTVAFEQIYEFATQDRPDLVKAFGPMRKPINDRADLFRARLLETQPAHIESLQEFAGRAWRRTLSDAERSALRRFYNQLRDADIAHDPAIRLTLARILTSPAFLYRREEPAAGKSAAPVSRFEMASRLSYFLWSSAPDDPLRHVAAERTGPFSDDELSIQTRRMLADPRTRRLAIQFACQWLHLRDFDRNDDKNEKLYPQFASLRGDMYEETVQFFSDMFRNDGSVLGLINADHTFLNAKLAKHYGVGGVSGDAWRRVEGVRRQGRGGILGMASLLASQSGASRTSPILRGNWIYETLLGERLPRPPADVPQLPEAVPSGLTARQLIEQHSSVAACAKCHARIDPYGFALEQYDAIGRLREQPVDTRTQLVDGREIEGLAGLRDYLLSARRDDVVRQFCRKLLGFALGREVQLSDELLLAEMQQNLAANNYRFNVAVETIVLSKQFQEVRGREFTEN